MTATEAEATTIARGVIAHGAIASIPVPGCNIRIYGNQEEYNGQNIQHECRECGYTLFD